MAFRDTIEALDLSDEAKAALIAEHESETQSSLEEAANLRRENRRQAVEAEIAELSDSVFKGNPGLAKYVRHVYLSDDGEPGTILLSDDELGLSGDQAIGARESREISTADVLRGFINLLPKDDSGKVMFSDQALVEHAADPPGSGSAEDEAESKRAGARERLGNIGGFKGERSRKRYEGGV